MSSAYYEAEEGPSAPASEGILDDPDEDTVSLGPSRRGDVGAFPDRIIV